MGFLDKIRSWWNKDTLERAEEETHMTRAERDLAETDYEGRKEDVEIRSGRLAGGAGDFERDSEPPRPY
jgi:hypothetical protein